jgi:hypothetical protein
LAGKPPQLVLSPEASPCVAWAHSSSHSEALLILCSLGAWTTGVSMECTHTVHFKLHLFYCQLRFGGFGTFVYMSLGEETP